MNPKTQPTQALDKKIDNYFEEELMDSMADVQGEVKTIIRQHIQSFLKKAKEENGINIIKNNLNKSFFGKFSDAMKNGYKMDKHYVIVDWIFFHELLEKLKQDTLAKEEFGSLAEVRKGDKV